MKLEKPDIDSYASKFSHEDQQNRFIEGYEEIHDSIELEEIEPSVREDISFEREHVDLVRSISSGFHQDEDVPGTDSGFKFTCTDPLSELNTVATEADVLLTRTREFTRIQLCVVACEIGDERVSEWISNINSIHEVYSNDDYISRLQEQIGYPGKQLDAVQYITLVKSEDFEDLDFHQIQKRCNPDEFALWSVDMNGVAELCHEGGELIHGDLFNIVKDCFDYDVKENPIAYTLRSDPIIPLQNVLFRLIRGKDIYENTEKVLEFDRSEFKETYNEKLKLSTPADIREGLVDDTVRKLLYIGRQIGILSRSDASDLNDYRIMYQGSGDAQTAKEATKRKYVKAVSEQRASKEAFQDAKDKYDSGQKGLDEFAED